MSWLANDRTSTQTCIQQAPKTTFSTVMNISTEMMLCLSFGQLIETLVQTFVLPEGQPKPSASSNPQQDCDLPSPSLLA